MFETKSFERLSFIYEEIYHKWIIRDKRTNHVSDTDVVFFTQSLETIGVIMIKKQQIYTVHDDLKV